MATVAYSIGKAPRCKYNAFSPWLGHRRLLTCVIKLARIDTLANNLFRLVDSCFDSVTLVVSAYSDL